MITDQFIFTEYYFLVIENYFSLQLLLAIFIWSNRDNAVKGGGLPQEIPVGKFIIATKFPSQFAVRIIITNAWCTFYDLIISESEVGARGLVPFDLRRHAVWNDLSWYKCIVITLRSLPRFNCLTAQK